MDKEIKTTKIALFKGRKIRKTIHQNEWWFSVVDVIAALTDSLDPNDYWYRMKIRVKDEEKIELSTNCRQLKLESSDNKKYETDCAESRKDFEHKLGISKKEAKESKHWLRMIAKASAVREIENEARLLWKESNELQRIFISIINKSKANIKGNEKV